MRPSVRAQVEGAILQAKDAPLQQPFLTCDSEGGAAPVGGGLIVEPWRSSSSLVSPLFGKTPKASLNCLLIDPEGRGAQSGPAVPSHRLQRHYKRDHQINLTASSLAPITSVGCTIDGIVSLLAS